MVTGVVLDVPSAYGYRVQRPGRSTPSGPYRLTSIENARTVVFGSGAKYSSIHVIPGEQGSDAEPVHLAEFITGYAVAS